MRFCIAKVASAEMITHPMIFSVFDMIHFGLIRRCMRIARPGIHSRDAGNLRVLSRCLASSLAATDSMVYRPFPPSAEGRPAVEPIQHNSAPSKYRLRRR